VNCACWRRCSAIGFASLSKVGKLRLKVLPLERILASKQAANRPKDQRVMPVLQNTLLTLQGRRKKKSKKKTPRKKC
jgi:hypothetical protein